jgi:hypothetical protein
MMEEEPSTRSRSKMKLKVTEVEVWVATIEDRAGGLAETLAPLAAVGASLEFVIARRVPEQPGKGVVFVTPLKGEDQVKAATQAGFLHSGSLHSLRIEGVDQPGLGAMITKARASEGINLRGLSAAIVSKKFVCCLALDTAEDAEKALRTVKNLS